MTTYADQLKPYMNFENKDQMDKSFNLFRKKFRHLLTDSDNKVLFTLKGYAVKFPGACKMELEKIALAAGVSVSTVKRAITKAVKLGIIKKISTRKQNGRRQGVTVYQYQEFISELQDEQQTMDFRQNCDNSSNDKVECNNSEPEALKSLSPSLVLKDTNITDMPDKSVLLKQGLLNKIPSVLAKAIGPFMNSTDDIFNLVGTIFRAKNKIDKSVQVEQHEQLYHKAIVSVFESEKRAVKKNKEFNIFGVMYKAITEITKSIVNGEAYQAKDPKQVPKVVSKEPIMQWIIDNEKDPVRKNELQVMKTAQEQQDLVSRSKEQVPEWMKNRTAVNQTSPTVNNTEYDENYFAMKRELVLQKLAGI